MAKSKTSEDALEVKAPKLEKKKIFKLSDYKTANNLNNSKFKEQKWIELSPAFKEVLGIPGIPVGQVITVGGHSDTGKTTILLEAAVSAQKMGILPVFIITEMKWSWSHAKIMGLELTENFDPETGESTSIDGDFLYADRTQLKSIEGVAQFINKLLDDQEKGKLPYDLLFLWDSVGSIPCEMSIEKGKNNNEWNAGAMSVQFGNHVNQRVVASRKYEYPYTNTFLCINKVWVRKPSNPMGQPKLEFKGGTTQKYDSGLTIICGNEISSGVNKIKAVKNGKEITFANRASIKVDKNHINGISTGGKIIITPTGFILDDKKDLENYKKNNISYFYDMLGSDIGDIETVIEETEDTVEQFSAEPEE
jgi:hypothetical protein